jgi:hypothetical protein
VTDRARRLGDGGGLVVCQPPLLALMLLGSDPAAPGTSEESKPAATLKLFCSVKLLTCAGASSASAYGLARSAGHGDGLPRRAAAATAAVPSPPLLLAPLPPAPVPLPGEGPAVASPCCSTRTRSSRSCA